MLIISRSGKRLLFHLAEVKALNSSYTALVLPHEHTGAYKSLGIKTVGFVGLQDMEGLRKLTSEYDAAIYYGNGFFHQGAQAIVLGLGDRTRKTGQRTYYHHVGRPHNSASRWLLTKDTLDPGRHCSRLQRRPEV